MRSIERDQRPGRREIGRQWLQGESVNMVGLSQLAIYPLSPLILAIRLTKTLGGHRSHEHASDGVGHR